MTWKKLLDGLKEFGAKAFGFAREEIEEQTKAFIAKTIKPYKDDPDKVWADLGPKVEPQIRALIPGTQWDESVVLIVKNAVAFGVSEYAAVIEKELLDAAEQINPNG